MFFTVSKNAAFKFLLLIIAFDISVILVSAERVEILMSNVTTQQVSYFKQDRMLKYLLQKR